MKQLAVLGILALLLVLGVKCTPGHEEGEHSDSHHLLEILEHVSVDSLEYNFSRFDYLDSAKLVLIHQLVEGSEQFFIPKRTGEMATFPCANCHTQSLTALQQGKASGEKKSHWNIELVHAKEATMQCATCHDYSSFNQLHSLTGTPIEFDHSYQLCGQCHSTQLKDWLGGAHGKQLGGWSEPRVSQTCTGCHNPHKPAFETRLPSRYNTEMAEQ